VKTVHRTLDAADAAPTWIPRYVTVVGRCYGIDGVCAVLGLRPDDVRAELAQGHLLSIEGPGGEPLFPVWQFPHGERLPHLAEVLEALGDADPVNTAQWFCRCRRELNGLPAAIWLQGGDPESVLHLVRRTPPHLEETPPHRGEEPLAASADGR
jgi:hypothetical protein